MELELFHLSDITKNSVIKVIDNTGTSAIIQHNICANLKKKGIKMAQVNISPLNVDSLDYDYISKMEDYFVIFSPIVAEQSHLESYLSFIERTKFYCYLAYYSANDCYQLGASITFVCGISSQKDIKTIYDQNINKNCYTFEFVSKLFEKYNVIVITDNGKRILRYHPEYVHEYIMSYHDKNFNSKHISKLIKQIEEDKSIYHMSNDILHKHLRSHVTVLKMCHCVIFLLNNYECYADVKILILVRFLTLCTQNMNINDIVDMSAKNGHRYSSDYWIGYYFLEKFNI